MCYTMNILMLEFIMQWLLSMRGDIWREMLITSISGMVHVTYQKKAQMTVNLLEELEQDNILNELLLNTRLSFYLHQIYEEADTFGSDLDAPNVADILEEEV